MIHRDVEALMADDLLDLNDLVVILDSYYRTKVVEPIHYQKITEHFIKKGFGIEKF